MVHPAEAYRNRLPAPRNAGGLFSDIRRESGDSKNKSNERSSFPVTGEESRSRFFERLYSPAGQFLTWIELLTLIAVLWAYVARPRQRKSLLVIGSLGLLILTAASFSALEFLQRTRFIAEAPAQFVYSSLYLARVLRYFGIAGLGIGLLASRPATDASTG